MSKVRPYTGVGYDDLIVQRQIHLIPYSIGQGVRLWERVRLYFLEDLESRQSPSHEGVRVLYRKPEHRWQVRNPFIRTSF